jgi:hypothetical protein
MEWIQYCTGGVTVLIVVIGFLKELSSNDEYRDPNSKKLTPKGKRFSLFGLLIVLLTIVSTGLSTCKDAWQEKQNRVAQQKLEKDLRLQNDLSNEKLATAFGEGLKKYYLKYDTAQMIIEKLVLDSSKRTIIKETNLPVLIVNKIAPKKKTKSSVEYYVEFSSYQAGSTGFNFYAYLIYADSSGKYHYGGLLNAIPFSVSLPQNKPLDVDFTMRAQKYKEFYIYLTGSYTNLDGSKTIPLNTVYYYSPGDNGNGLLGEPQSTDIIEFLKSKLTK